MPFELKLKPLTREDVTIQILIEQDWTDPADHFDDEQAVKDINFRLDCGDTWAWCDVTVQASWRSFKGSAAIGSCSYTDEDEFRADSPYFDDLVTEAIKLLNESMQADLDTLARRIDWEHIGEPTPIPDDLSLLTDTSLEVWMSTIHAERREVEDRADGLAQLLPRLLRKINANYGTLLNEKVHRQSKTDTPS